MIIGVIFLVILWGSIVGLQFCSWQDGFSKFLSSDEKAFIMKETVDKGKSTLKIASQDSLIPSNSRPRVYFFVFPMFLQSGEWVKVTGVIIPRLKDVKVKLTYTNPKGEMIIRYASTSGGGRFADLFYPKSVGRWKVMASWNSSSFKEVYSDVLEFTVRRPTLFFYALLISLVSLIAIALYLSFVFFI
ncbi:MAG: hypothetical protein DRO00_08810 [Thermoproteota archaeon]|nr:MAG: hypothetical protein DRO00_08810 [Candidatus Korarchaeota archaeon]